MNYATWKKNFGEALTTVLDFPDDDVDGAKQGSSAYQRYQVLRLLATRTYPLSDRFAVYFVASEKPDLHEFSFVALASGQRVDWAQVPQADLIRAAWLKTEIEAWLSGRREALPAEAGRQFGNEARAAEIAVQPTTRKREK